MIRKDIDKLTQVYYCSRKHGFISNWTAWDMKDCLELEDVDPDERVFGALLDGLFVYVEDDKCGKSDKE